MIRNARIVWRSVYFALAIISAFSLWYLDRTYVSKRNWVLGEGLSVTANRRDGVTSHGELFLDFARDGSKVLRVRNLSARRGESGQLDRIQVLESKSGLVGILVQPRILWVGPNLMRGPNETWTAFVLRQNLSFVVQPRSGEVIAIDETALRANGIASQFLAEITALDEEVPDVLKGIDFMNLDGPAARAEEIASLAAFRDLNAISIEETTVDVELVNALASLNGVSKLWFSYIKFGDGALNAIAQLRSLKLIVIPANAVDEVPNGNAIVGRIRSTLAEMEIRVVDSDAD